MWLLFEFYLSTDIDNIILSDRRYRGVVRFFPDDPIWIFVLYRDNCNAEKLLFGMAERPKIG